MKNNQFANRRQTKSKKGTAGTRSSPATGYLIFFLFYFFLNFFELLRHPLPNKHRHEDNPSPNEKIH